MDDVAGGDGVSGVDFSDEEKAIDWLETQSAEVRSAIASRAALRVCANIYEVGAENLASVALPIFRAILTASVYGFGRGADLDYSESAANAYRYIANLPEGSATLAAARSAALSADSADPSAFASAFAAEFAVRSAASNESENSAVASFATPVWSEGTIPQAIGGNHEALLAYFNDDRSTWGFWHDWYLAMWEGRFTDFDLAHEVAMIPNDVWEQGPEAVANAIREIEEKRAGDLPRPDNVPELEREKLLKYVERLLASPEMTALAAEGAAATLRRAITEYLVKADVNCLPDEFKHLEGLPALFKGISLIVKSGRKSEATVSDLANQIESLNGQVAKLEADLKLALSKTVNGLFKQSAIKAAGAAFGGGVAGTLGVALAHFFGGWPDDFTLENLRSFLSELETATPKAEVANSLPPATDV